MGIRDTVQTKVAAAFDGKLADAVTAFAAERVTVSDVYDPSTGTYPETTTAYSGRGVFGSYSVQEVDGQHVRRTDVRLKALQSEVTRDSDGATFAPAVDDRLAGYDVINVGQDPASATWTVQLRRT